LFRGTETLVSIDEKGREPSAAKSQGRSILSKTAGALPFFVNGFA
jgi:hypothetical protein